MLVTSNRDQAGRLARAAAWLSYLGQDNNTGKSDVVAEEQEKALQTCGVTGPPAYAACLYYHDSNARSVYYVSAVAT
jgi:hypothetical protein